MQHLRYNNGPVSEQTYQFGCIHNSGAQSRRHSREMQLLEAHSVEAFVVERRRYRSDSKLLQHTWDNLTHEYH